MTRIYRVNAQSKVKQECERVHPALEKGALCQAIGVTTEAERVPRNGRGKKAERLGLQRISERRTEKALRVGKTKQTVERAF